MSPASGIPTKSGRNSPLTFQHGKQLRSSPRSMGPVRLICLASLSFLNAAAASCLSSWEHPRMYCQVSHPWLSQRMTRPCKCACCQHTLICVLGDRDCSAVRHESCKACFNAASQMMQDFGFAKHPVPMHADCWQSLLGCLTDMSLELSPSSIRPYSRWDWLRDPGLLDFV